MRKFYILILTLVIGLISEAQPNYWNALPTAGANVFPFNTLPATGKKVQWLVAAGEFIQPGPAPAGNNITGIWFRPNAACNATYTNLTIRMATVSTSTFLTTGAWYTGPMTTVRQQNTTITQPVALTWTQIPLTTPFLYDPTMNLIIEVYQCGFTGTGFSIFQQAYGAAPNRRRQYSDASSVCGAIVLATGGDQNVPAIGISVSPAASPCAQNFDGVAAPALPASWAASTPITCGGSLPWATQNTIASNPPNSAFSNNPACISDEVLDSRIFPIVSPTAQLTFRNRYDLESTFDGMVLEISIGGGPFADIITAGGSFVTGGYNATISAFFGSPIAGQQAWSGNSGGFITTTVNLPAAANGQNVVLRWRRATDNSVSQVGAWIDDITITGSNCAAACVITCPANITVVNAANQCGQVVNYPAPTSNGACGTVTTSPASGSFFPVGTTTVTASTFAGPSCTFTVTVTDAQPPTITCPANMTVNNSPGFCGANVSFTPTATDNCPGVVITSVPASGSFFPKGTTNVTSTATDASGNTASCSFTITVVDNEPPAFVSPGLFPERLYYKFDGSGTSVPNLASAPPPGTATATITGLTQGSTGKCGTALVGTGVASQSMNTNWATNMAGSWSICFWLGANQVDNNPSYLWGDVTAGSFRCFYGGAALTNNILFRGGTGDILITGVNPAATFITIVYNGVNTVVYKNGGSPQTYAVTFANAGAGPFRVGGYSTSSSINGAMDEFGMYTRALTPAEVLSIYNTCPVNVNNCPANITVNNTPGACSAVVNYPTPVGVDNCPGVVTAQIAGLPSGSAFPVGTTVNTFRATDAGGLTALCTFSVTVNDIQAPVVTCPPSVVRNTDPNVCTSTYATPNPTITDNCSIASVSWVMTGATTGASPLTGINYLGTQAFGLTGTTGQGITTVTYTVKDPSGNTTTCSYTVTVNDASIPVISGQPTNQFVCVGSNGAFSVTATAGAGNPLTYQWQGWNGSA
ncbi:MAG: HYR domain-containing protein [Chitinophagaceae bacterium]|nr:HYR domain-containing protein [Chitinophagaceae bacterium]